KGVPTVQVDNERVRVTEWRFAPGAETGEHIHEFDYVVVPSGNGRLKLVSPKGEEGFADLKLGVSYFRKAGVHHNVINANAYEFACVEIEWKSCDMATKTTFELDGKPVEAEPGETIWQVAQRHGTKIPHLCWHPAPGYRADGNCRACMVEVEGERVLAASCQRKAAPGMKVKTATERAKKSREMVFELLM